jgi:hypothetical protein
MNDHDFLNLRFLLLSPPEVLADWYVKMDEDDHEYAMEILKAARIEDVMAIMQEAEDDDIELTEAQKYLSKFTLGGVQ